MNILEENVVKNILENDLFDDIVDKAYSTYKEDFIVRLGYETKQIYTQYLDMFHEHFSDGKITGAIFIFDFLLNKIDWDLVGNLLFDAYMKRREDDYIADQYDRYNYGR